MVSQRSGISVDNFASLLLVSLNLKMADDDSLQDSRRGVPGDILILQEVATVATAPSVASQGSAAVFQRRARRTLLEMSKMRSLCARVIEGFRVRRYMLQTGLQQHSLFQANSWDPSISNLRMQLAKLSKSRNTFKMSLCQT